MISGRPTFILFHTAMALPIEDPMAGFEGWMDVQPKARGLLRPDGADRIEVIPKRRMNPSPGGNTVPAPAAALPGSKPSVARAGAGEDPR